MEIGHLGVHAASLAREEFNHSSASIRVWQVPTYEHAHVVLTGTSQTGMCDFSFSFCSSFRPEVEHNQIEVVSGLIALLHLVSHIDSLDGVVIKIFFYKKNKTK